MNLDIEDLLEGMSKTVEEVNILSKKEVKSLKDRKAEIHAMIVTFHSNLPERPSRVEQIKLIEYKQELKTINLQLSRGNLTDKDLDKISTIAAKLNELLHPSTKESTTALTSDSPIKNSKLFQIAPFDGNQLNFKTFFQSFNEEIDSLNIAVRRKFFALKKLINEENQDIFAGLCADQNGYQQAMKRLVDRYQDDFKIRRYIMDRLQKVKPVRSKDDIAGLRLLLTTVRETFQLANNINADSFFVEEIYQRLIYSRLPDEVRTAFTRMFRTKQSTETWIMYLEDEVASAELRSKYSEFDEWCRPTTRAPNRTQVSLVQPRMLCKLCSGEHTSFRCYEKTLDERNQIVVDQRLCRICFNHHPDQRCRSRYRCTRCRGAHSLNLCQQVDVRQDVSEMNEDVTNNQHQNESTSSEPQNEMSESTNAGAIIARRNSKRSAAYYQTCLVKVKNETVRILIDSGAGSSFITKSLVKRLKINQVPNYRLSVNGFGNKNEACSSDSEVDVTLKALHNRDGIEVRLNVVETFGRICAKPVPDEIRQRIASKGIMLTDVTEQESDKYPLEILIGLDYFNLVWVTDAIKIDERLKAQLSIFGWIAFGATDKESNDRSTNSLLIFEEFKDVNDYPPVCTNVWCDHELEASTAPPISTEFNQKFMSSIKYDNKRYQVPLPWLNQVKLNNNYHLALHRLNQLIKSLHRKNIYHQYANTIEEFHNLNFAEKVNHVEWNKAERIYYMPHHPIIREDKTTTKLRVVFDASAGSPSLNDNLFKGDVNYNLPALILSFRLYQFAVTADIEKAYLQIDIEPKDRDALRFLWQNKNGSIETYRMKSVPFGTAASPFLLNATLKQHFDNMKSLMPEAVAAIENQFYVDDLVLSVSSIDEVKRLKEESVVLMKYASMNLRKWCTNNLTINHTWNEVNNGQQKILGMAWNNETDTLNIAFNHEIPKVLTKRMLSEIIGKIYDPLGLVIPVVMPLRQALRLCWTQNIEWDEQVPSAIQSTILPYLEQLHTLPNVTFERWHAITKKDVRIMHVFCDASKVAYGIVCYVANPQTNQSSLVYSKARLSPTTMTIPELELRAIHLAARTVPFIIKVLQPTKVIVWSDSNINIVRLSEHPNKYKPNVAEKLLFIKNNLQATFLHIPGKQNPADLTTRGVLPKKLKTNNLWMHGPAEMFKNLDIDKENIEDHTICLALQTITAIATNKSEIEQSLLTNLFDKHMDYHKQIRLAKLFSNFINQSRRIKKLNQEISPLITLIRISQHSYFSRDIQALFDNRPVSSAYLGKLALFIDELGLIRLRSRLQDSALFSYEQKNPIVLHPTSSTAYSIILHHHRINGHSGCSRTMESFRDQYYIPRARQITKKIIRHCVLCQRFSKELMQAPFGNVPESRSTRPTRAFEFIGIDLFGPLKTTCVAKKYYGMIFTCTTSRAIHLELLEGEDTLACFEAFRRFMARRGIPSVVHSDNGRNLIKLDKTLKQLLQALKEVPANTEELNIKWIYQAPLAPWRNGFFERLIKTVRESLNKLTFRKPPRVSGLLTLLTEIEAIINSRPLFWVDNQAITPSHFLIGKRLTTIPPLTYKIDLSNNQLLTTYRTQQRMVNAFWSRWIKLYLLQLKVFHQQTSKLDQLKIDDVVIIHDANRPRSHWPLGRIVQLMPGPDGITRTYLVQYGNGNQLVRAAQRLVKLELPPGECDENVNLALSMTKKDQKDDF